MPHTHTYTHTCTHTHTYTHTHTCTHTHTHTDLQSDKVKPTPCSNDTPNTYTHTHTHAHIHTHTHIRFIYHWYQVNPLTARMPHLIHTNTDISLQSLTDELWCTDKALLTKLNKQRSRPWTPIGWHKKSTRFIRLTSLNSIPNFIQIHTEFCEITGTKVCAFLHLCDLESNSRSLKTRIKIQDLISSIVIPTLHQIVLESIWMHVIFLDLINLSQNIIRPFSLNWLSKFHPDEFKKNVQKMKPREFALCWLCDPQPKSMSLKMVKNSRNQWCL